MNRRSVATGKPKPVKSSSLGGSFVSIVGPGQVLTDPHSLASYSANCTGLTRRILGILRPSTVEEVVGIVRLANRHKTALYPVSRGKNWGYGSRLPVQHDAFVVDLSRLNRIRNAKEISARNPVAIVEPGVTQGGLFALLEKRKLPLMFNVTGSGVETSILGNALDRGVGYFGSKADDLLALEVVLGNGEIVRTGFGDYPHAAAAHDYKAGLGPSLDGLFFQSNFGIVTTASFALMARPPVQVAMIAKLKDERHLKEFITLLGDLRRERLLDGVVHIGNRARTISSLAPLAASHLQSLFPHDPAALRKETLRIFTEEGFGPWSAVCGLGGTSRMVEAAIYEISQRLKGKISVSFLSDRDLDRLGEPSDPNQKTPPQRQALVLALRELHGLCLGRPTNAALSSVGWAAGTETLGGTTDPDLGHGGMLFCNPVIPLCGQHAQTVVSLIHRVTKKYDFVPSMTLNMESRSSIVCIVNIAFDRRDRARISRAHRCMQELETQLMKQGYYPYRLAIHQMHTLRKSGKKHREIVQGIKHLLDPKAVIAPGRYLPETP